MHITKNANGQKEKREKMIQAMPNLFTELSTDVIPRLWQLPHSSPLELGDMTEYLGMEGCCQA